MAQTTQTSSDDRAKVLSFPPAVGAILILIGIVLHLLCPLHILDNGWLALILGVLVLAVGVGLQVACIRVFKRAQTTPLFQKPTTKVLQHGLYATSRNPIYIAVLFQFLGLALLVNTAWLLLMLLIVFLYLHFGVISGEERYLEQKFGDEYKSYKSKVRRWV